MNMTQNSTPTQSYYTDTIAPTQSLAAETASKTSPGGAALDALLAEMGITFGK